MSRSNNDFLNMLQNMLYIVKALFRVGMQVAPFILKIQNMLFLTNNAVSLF